MLEEYFLNPMGQYYTVVGSLTYAVLFFVAIWIVYKYVLKKMSFKVDSIFMLSLVPFIILGGITRALKDAGFYSGFFFMSPGIYITLFFVTLAALLVSVTVSKRLNKPYWIFMLAIGTFLATFSAVQGLIIGIANWDAVFMILGLFGFWAIVVAAFQRKFPGKFSKENAGVTYSHIMDASQNFVGITFFGYSSQMPLPFATGNILGSWIIFPIKIAIVLTSMLVIDKYSKDIEFNYWLKIAILILGLPMGFRGLFRIGMGV